MNSKIEINPENFPQEIIESFINGESSRLVYIGGISGSGKTIFALSLLVAVNPVHSIYINPNIDRIRFEKQFPQFTAQRNEIIEIIDRPKLISFLDSELKKSRASFEGLLTRLLLLKIGNNRSAPDGRRIIIIDNWYTVLLTIIRAIEKENYNIREKDLIDKFSWILEDILSDKNNLSVILVEERVKRNAVENIADISVYLSETEL